MKEISTHNLVLVLVGLSNFFLLMYHDVFINGNSIWKTVTSFHDSYNIPY